MAGEVRRGGLLYPIEVQDRFSQNLRRFREEVRQARQEFARFRAETAKQSAQSLRQQLALQKQQAQVAAAEARAEEARTRAASRRAQAIEQANTRRERAERRASTEAERAARAEQKAQNDRLRNLQAVARERARIEQGIGKIEVQRRKDEAANTAAKERAQRALTTLSRREIADAAARGQVFARLRQSLLETESGANRVAFTFRRLFGILAAFTIAREAIAGFGNLIRLGVEFNRTLETSRIGLAALFVATGRVRNSYGELVHGAEAFDIATARANEQIAQLRKDALLTTATFSELVTAFQTAVGPGLAAGLNLDQVRQLSVSISQAATALGLAQNQLAEEVRSILQGTITPRNTRIATALGITNDDIRRAREAGTLFEFLRSRMAGFAIAGERAQETFEGLSQRVREAFEITTGDASLGFFEELKTSLREVSDLLVTVKRDSEGLLLGVETQPRAIAIFRELFDGLGEAVRIFREAVSKVEFTELQNTAVLMGNVFRTLATVAGGAIRGLIKGLNGVAIAASDVARLLGISRVSVENFFSVLVQLGTSLVGLSLAFSVVRAGVRLLFAPFVTAAVAVLRLHNAVASLIPVIAALGRGLLTALVNPFTIATGVLIGLSIILNKVFDTITGGTTRFLTFIQAVAVAVANAFGQIALAIAEFVLRIPSRIEQALRVVAGKVASALAPLVEAVAVLSSIVSQDAADKLFRAQAALQGFAKESTNAKERVSDLAQEIHATREALENATPQDLTDIFLKDEGGTDLQSQIVGAVTSAVDAVKGLLGRNLVDERGVKEGVEEGVGAGAEGTIEGQNNEVGKLQKFLEGIVENFENGLSIVRGAVQSFSSFAADAIVSAFDPNNDQTLKEKFGRFLQDLSKLIINELTKVAIAKAILGLGFGGGSGLAEGGQVQGFAEGGRIPRRRGRASLAHFAGPQGLARGGRPAGLDPRDTVPIWAQPGEFMQPLSAVRTYGLDVMEAIRRRLIDPSALRALAGSGRVSRRIRRPTGGGFAEGGEINQARQTASALSSEAPAQSAGMTVLPVMVADNQTMSRQLAGGKKAFFDFIEEHSSELNTRLGR